MNSYILDVNTSVMINGLKKLGYVYKVKPGDTFEEKKEDGYSSVTFTYADYSNMERIKRFFENKNIVGVLSFNEKTRAFWFQFAKEMRIQTNIKECYVENQNKIVSRKKTNTVLLNKVKWNTISDFLKLPNKSFPVVVKPIKGTGSINVTKCNSTNDILAAIKNKNPSDFFVEEYIEGKEYSVEAIHINGGSIIYGVTTKLKYPNTLVEAGQISNLIELSESEKEEMKKIYRVLQYSDTVSHTEIILNKRGLFYVESHPRLGGDLIPTLTQSKFTDDFYSLVMKICLGKIKDVTLKKQKTIRFSLFPIPQKFPAVFYFSDKDISFFKESVGSYIVFSSFKNKTLINKKPESSYDRPLTIAAEANTRSEMENKINKIEDYCDKHIFKEVEECL